MGHPNGAITPHDPNLAAATAAHLAPRDMESTDTPTITESTEKERLMPSLFTTLTELLPLPCHCHQRTPCHQVWIRIRSPLRIRKEGGSGPRRPCDRILCRACRIPLPLRIRRGSRSFSLRCPP